MKYKKNIVVILLILILGLAFFIRYYKLSQIPAGVYTDEAFLGYNAYSILKTGKDEFGKSWPIYFRGFSTFQDSLYGYFSIIPIYFLGLNIFSTRLVSVVSGLIIVLISFLFFYYSSLKDKLNLGFIASIVVAFVPWTVYQSRVAVGSNLGLALTAIGILLLILSIKKRWLFVVSCIIFGIASYAYAAQRITGILFPLAFVFINKKIYLQSKKIIIIGLTFFTIIMLFQFTSLFHTGPLVRYQTQGYTQKGTYLRNGDSLTKLPTFVGWPLYISRQFTSQYISVFSPRSLFFDPEPQLYRSIPNLSVFYFWMTIPFFVGISEMWKRRSDLTIQTIFLLMVIGVIPEALTGDPFYTLRMLIGMWGITLMIALGIKTIIDSIKANYLKILLVIFVILISFFDLYICYFIFLKHERSVDFGYPFQVLAQMTESDKNETFVLDSEMFGSPYIWLAFYKKHDPVELQKQVPLGVVQNYYDDLTLYSYKTIGNVDVRKIKWGVDDCTNQYIVGDLAAVSVSQAQEHGLTLIKEIKDLNNKTILWMYHTNPNLKCDRNMPE